MNTHTHEYIYSPAQANLTPEGVKTLANRYCIFCLEYQEIILHPVKSLEQGVQNNNPTDSQPNIIRAKIDAKEVAEYIKGSVIDSIIFLQNEKNEKGGYAGFNIEFFPFEQKDRQFQGTIFLYQTNPKLYAESFPDLIERMKEYCIKVKSPPADGDVDGFKKVKI